MIKTIFGFTSGLYIGSYYNIKPQFEYIKKIIKENTKK